MKIFEGVVKLADRLWPDAVTDDGEAVAHEDALFLSLPRPR
jgi:hypothetical protein